MFFFAALNNKETSSFYYTMDNPCVKQLIDEIKGRLRENQETISVSKSENRAKDNIIQELQRGNATLYEENEKVQAQLRDMMDGLKRVESTQKDELSATKDSLNELETRFRKQTVAKGILDKECDRLSNQIQEQQEKNEQLQQENENMMSEMARKNAQIQEQQEKNGELTQQLQFCRQVNNNLQQTLQKQKQQVQEYEEKNFALHEKNIKLRDEMIKKNAKVEKLETTNKKLLRMNATCKKETSKRHESETKHLKEKIESLRKENDYIMGLNRSLSDNLARYVPNP